MWIKKNQIVFTGTIFYFISFVLSIIYYEQRVGILDASFQLFEILRTNSFAIQANRFGAALTQIFPLVGNWMGLPLPFIAILYSTSFIIYYFISFLLVAVFYKNERLALIVLLFNALITTHTFFWIQCEAVQGTVFTITYLAFVEHQIKKGTMANWFHFISPITLIIIVFFYPLLPIIVIFILVFLFLEYKIMGRWLFLISTQLVLIYLIKINFFNNAYDTQAASAINNLSLLFPNYLDLPSNKVFLEWMLKDYYLLPLFSIWIILFYIKKRASAKLILFVSFFIGYLTLINVSYYDRAVHQFYLEPQYSILSIFIAFPLAYHILPTINIKLRNIVLAAVILLFITRILITEKEYTQRVSWFKTTIHTIKDKRILHKEELPIDLLKMTWASPYEFWLISTIETGTTSSIITQEQTEELDWAKKKKFSKKFLTRWASFDYRDLNSQYFILKDTVDIYKD